jgi:hydrogenase maturation protease
MSDNDSLANASPLPKRILIVGLGNPILGDDGVGWRVAEEVQRQIVQRQAHPRAPEECDIEVDCVALGGLSLMEQLIGYDRAIVIDSIDTGHGAIGRVHQLELDELPDRSAGHTTAIHDTSLQTALKVGRSLGAQLPDRITVIAVESPNVYNFSEELSAPVAAAVPVAAQLVMDLLYLSQEELPYGIT